MMSLRRKDQDRVIVVNNAKPKVELVHNEDLTLFRELHTRRNVTSLLHPLSDEFDSSVSFLHPHPNGNLISISSWNSIISILNQANIYKSNFCLRVFT